MPIAKHRLWFVSEMPSVQKIKRTEEYRRQLQLIFEAKYLVNIIDEFQNSLNLILDLQQNKLLKKGRSTYTIREKEETVNINYNLLMHIRMYTWCWCKACKSNYHNSIHFMQIIYSVMITKASTTRFILFQRIVNKHGLCK